MLRIYDCGLKPYDKVLQFQMILVNHRRQGKIPDTVILVEHTPVVTLGARESANKLLLAPEDFAAKKIDLVPIRRGGGATAHNEGQLVFYPVLDLEQLGLGVTEYIRQLEHIGIELLAHFNVPATQKEGFPGLWVNGKKIASIGVRVSKHITFHGMAINLANDLAIFNTIVPCGIEGVQMTSVLETTGNKPDMNGAKDKLKSLLTKYWARGGQVEYGSK